MPILIKKILWPTDFSAFSLQGGRYARGLCEAFGARLHVIHVIPPLLAPDFSLMVPADLPFPVPGPDLIEPGRRSLEKLVAEHLGGDPGITLDVFLGSPWSVICDYAQREQIDLIVIATHGRTGLEHAIIGSTAERIVRHAPCPVLTVKNHLPS
jgi:universal stress protein A